MLIMKLWMKMQSKILTKFKRYIFLGFFFIFLLSCNSTNQQDILWSNAQESYSSKDFNNCLVNLNLIIIDDNYNGELKAKALFLASEIYLNEFKENDIAISFLDRIIDNYPKHPMAKRSLFTKAYINANYIESYTVAVSLYNKFLNMYPNDDLISSVKYELAELEKHESTISNLINN